MAVHPFRTPAFTAASPTSALGRQHGIFQSTCLKCRRLTSCSKTRHSSTQMQEDADCLARLGDKRTRHINATWFLPIKPARTRTSQSESSPQATRKKDCFTFMFAQHWDILCQSVFSLRQLQRCTREADSALAPVWLALWPQLKRFSVEPCQRSSSGSKNTCCAFPLIVFVIVRSV